MQVHSEKTKVFVNKANIIHNNRYIYEKSQYSTNAEKLEITCVIHGSFFQTPSNHLAGRGCPECGKKVVKKSKVTTASFISKAKKFITINMIIRNLSILIVR